MLCSSLDYGSLKKVNTIEQLSSYKLLNMSSGGDELARQICFQPDFIMSLNVVLWFLGLFMFGLVLGFLYL